MTSGRAHAKRSIPDEVPATVGGAGIGRDAALIGGPQGSAAVGSSTSVVDDVDLGEFGERPEVRRP